MQIQVRNNAPTLLPSERRILVLVGPTASGKTSLSLLLAERLNGEIISADSRQVYKFMDIGTAKPPKEERARVKHYFVDELLPDQYFSAGEFGKRGREIIDEIFRAGRQPIVVGGSGLYIQALVDGFFEGPGREEEIRRQLSDRLRREGPETLFEELKRVDPEAAARMTPSNTRRIMRALEVFYVTGAPISRQQQEHRVEIPFLPVLVGLQWERKELYARVDARVDRMIASGLIDEVRRLKTMGYDTRHNALLTVGYEEVFDYLEGRTDEAEMVRRVKQNSRRYAKRQLTWFRRDKRIKWYPVSGEKDFAELADEVVRDWQSVQG